MGIGHNSATPITLDKGDLQSLQSRTQTALSNLENTLAYKAGIVIATTNDLKNIPQNTPSHDILGKFNTLLAARDNLEKVEPQANGEKPFTAYVAEQLKTGDNALPALWAKNRTTVMGRIEADINKAAADEDTSLDINALRKQLQDVIKIDGAVEKATGVKVSEAAQQATPQRRADATGTTASSFTSAFNQIIGISSAVAAENPTSHLRAEDLLNKLDAIARAQNSITPEKAAKKTRGYPYRSGHGHTGSARSAGAPPASTEDENRKQRRSAAR